MPVRVLREHDVRSLIGMNEALEAVEASFHEQANGTGINQPRRRVRQPAGVLHMMGGALVARGYWGCKVYTSTRHGIYFMVHLYHGQSGLPLAMIESDYLGQLRTGAASGIATRYLAQPDADVLALFGSGFQAETQLSAIAAVRSLREVRVYSRTAERREEFASRMAQQHGLHVYAVDSSDAALAGASIITTATTSSDPVFNGKKLEDGVHINATGSNAVARSELDRATVRRADVIVTDDLEQAHIESGNLVMAYERNGLAWEQVRLLADVVAGRMAGRRQPQDVTLFASHGIALWDIALAATAYERAEAAQVGTLIELFSETS